MKRLLSILSALSIWSLLFVSSAAAVTSGGMAVNHAYAKPGNTFDVVVKYKPGAKIALYVNDQNPTYTTVNKKSWATFHKVKIADAGKLSFTRVFGTKTLVQKPINFVRYFQVSAHNVTFATTDPAKQVQAAPTTSVAPARAPTKKVVTPTPKPAPAPQPTCTNGSYVNSAGNRVCSPEAASSAPAGATAKCGDGTYSFSQSRRGTCSSHGGVASWL